MTMAQLKNIVALRKELNLIERQLKAYSEEVSRIARLQERQKRIVAELDAVEAFIDSIDNSILRQIVTLRFVEGMTAKDTATFVGYSQSQTKRILNSLNL